MNTLNSALLVLHFVGLAMGFSVTFANIVMASLISAATPPERGVLGRFPPLMSRIGEVGLMLLWVTGATLVMTKWGGFGALPWQFHAKLTAVVIVTLAQGYLHVLTGRAKRGDASAVARIPAVGRVASLAALTAVVFAVLTFD